MLFFRGIAWQSANVLWDGPDNEIINSINNDNRKEDGNINKDNACKSLSWLLKEVITWLGCLVIRRWECLVSTVRVRDCRLAGVRRRRRMVEDLIIIDNFLDASQLAAALHQLEQQGLSAFQDRQLPGQPLWKKSVLVE